MSVNAARMSAGDALATLREGWRAQASGDMTVSWMLHGRPGVGKTELVQSLANELGARLYDLRLTTIEPQDLRGLPYFDHETKRTVWYRPEDLPSDPKRPAVLFLDELTAASPHLQPTVYGLLQERRIGQHVLPDTVFIVAAGNMVEDGAIAYEMGSALSDRMIHLIVQADPTDWLTQYASAAGIHPSVAAFIRARPDLFETTEETLRSGRMIACTPRSWTRVSAIMSAVSDPSIRRRMIAGTVGEAAAAEFALVADEIEATVQIEDMLRATRKERAALYPKSLHGMTALAYGLASVANARNLSTGIEILADLPSLATQGYSGLPLAELARFGFELLIAKALKNGWQETFAASPAYAEYANTRSLEGLP